jgi:two-component system response regulator FixJ
MPDRRVYIVDDQRSVRDLLDSLLLALDYKPFSYAEASSFLEDLPRLRKGIVLLDVRMPDIDGLTVLGEIQRQTNTLRAITMTGHADVPTAVKAMQEGADDFIEKPFSKEALTESLERALTMRQKGTYVPPDPPAIERLSPRERQVLQGIVAGKTNKLIARDLGISHRTVEAHRARLMMKAGAGSVADLIRIALRD